MIEEKLYNPYTIYHPEKIQKLFKKVKNNKNLTKNEKEKGLQLIVNIAMKDKNINKIYTKAKTPLTKTEWVRKFLEQNKGE